LVGLEFRTARPDYLTARMNQAPIPTAEGLFLREYAGGIAFAFVPRGIRKATMNLHQFTLVIGLLPAETFRVQEFRLEEAVSECYSLLITATSGEDAFSYTDLICKPACLQIVASDFTIPHRGVVTGFRRFPDASGDFGRESYRYEMIIEPRFSTLRHRSANRVFLKKDVVAIVTEVLQGAGLSAADFRFGALGTFPVREFTVQYNESDLQFAQRLLEDEGIFYWFDHGGNKEVLCFGNSTSAVQPVAQSPVVRYEPSSGLDSLGHDAILGMELECLIGPGRVTLQDYNPDLPDTRISANAAGQGDLDLASFAPHARDQDGADRLAGLRAEMHDAAKSKLLGKGVCRGLRAGFRFRIEGDAPAGFAEDFALTRVVQIGNRRAGFSQGGDALQCRTEFSAIPAAKVFRPPLRTNKPRVHGVLLAKVDGVAGAYAYLDDEGRYHAKLPFDGSGRADGQASMPIRLSQPYAGANYGMHFPLHNGNDLVLAFVDGDIDRPIALGALPNPAMGSPVTNRNKSESIIRTASGHCLRMDDMQGKTSVDLVTADGHGFILDDTPASRGIVLESKGDHHVHLDDAGGLIRVRSKYGHEILLDDGGKSISIRTGGGHLLEMDDGAKTIALEDLSGKTKVEMDGGKGNVSVTASGDISLKADGSISFSAGKSLSTSSGEGTDIEAGSDFRMSAKEEANLKSGKSTSIQAGNDLVAKAGNAFQAMAKKGNLQMDNELQSKAAKIVNEADNSFQAKAGKLSLEAEGQLVLKGSQVTQN
jgi:type VI secretion system secreted protein VgrG